MGNGLTSEIARELHSDNKGQFPSGGTLPDASAHDYVCSLCITEADITFYKTPFTID